MKPVATAASAASINHSEFPAPSAKSPRLLSVDLLRGLVMIIMALDHTRDFFTYLRFKPEDLTHTYAALFFTRFITHFCAPVFCFLAGTGSFLAVSRGKSVQQVSWFFFSRGLWLVFLELTVVSFAWTFMFPFLAAAVLWSLGWSMVAMALLVRLPVRWIAVFGGVMVATHNLFDRIDPASFGKFSWLWMVLHSPGMYWIKPGTSIFILYALIPWIGVMALGYAFGVILLRPDRRKWILRLGLALTALFFIMRGLNLYGNGVAGLPFSLPRNAGPWSVQPTPSLTVISFLNALKYPPSLDYLLMTLGPAFIVLALFERMKGDGVVARVLLVYGRVPMFYYVIHLYLIHLMAIGVAFIYHQPVAWLWDGAFLSHSPPDGYGHGLPFIYLMWITAVALLYIPCRWFMQLKQRHRDWGWLSYF